MEEGASLSLCLLLPYQFPSEGPVWLRHSAESCPCVNHPESHTDSSSKPELQVVCVCVRALRWHTQGSLYSEESANQTWEAYWKMTCLNCTLKDGRN